LEGERPREGLRSLDKQDKKEKEGNEEDKAMDMTITIY